MSSLRSSLPSPAPLSPALPDLSVVVPAYDEEARLGASLGRILAFLDARGVSCEVLVVDDGSRDRTAEVATAHGDPRIRLLRQPRNLGKGAAIRRGVEASRGRRVLLTDADLSTPIEELPKLEAAIAGAEVVFGSRAVPGADVRVHQPRYRELMGKAFNWLIHRLGIAGIADTQCGFKLLDGEAARRVVADLITPGFAYDVELVWLARRFGLRVVEVGVVWENSPASRVRPLLDPPKMILEILRFRWRHRRLPESTAAGAGLSGVD